MYRYAELWNTRPAWTRLSADEQKEFLDKVGPSIEHEYFDQVNVRGELRSPPEVLGQMVGEVER